MIPVSIRQCVLLEKMLHSDTPGTNDLSKLLRCLAEALNEYAMRHDVITNEMDPQVNPEIRMAVKDSFHGFLAGDEAEVWAMLFCQTLICWQSVAVGGLTRFQI